MYRTSLPALDRELARVHNGRLCRLDQGKMAKTVQKCLENETNYRESNAHFYLGLEMNIFPVTFCIL